MCMPEEHDTVRLTRDFLQGRVQYLDFCLSLADASNEVEGKRNQRGVMLDDEFVEDLVLVCLYCGQRCRAGDVQHFVVF